MRRYARAAAAIFGLVTGLIGLGQTGSSLGAAGASAYTLLLVPLVLVSVAYSGLLAVGSGAVLIRGDGARLGGRVAAVLLAGAALGYLPLVIVTSPEVAVGAILPATAAAILVLTTRDGAGSAAAPAVARLSAVGRIVLLGIAIAAVGWSAVQLAGMTAGESISGLAGYAGVRAAVALATLHVAFAVAATRFTAGALLAAGALDVVLGIWAIPTEPLSLLGALLLGGVALVALGILATRTQRRVATA